MPDTIDAAVLPPATPAIVVAGASAGGVSALVTLVGALPPDFPFPVLVVLHVAASGTSVLPAILARAGRLPVRAASDGEQLAPGHVYVAPPDSHLLVEGSLLRLSQAPRENGHRPAIDPTMRSAARSHPGRAIGIVLSGARDDGTAGLVAIKATGGLAIVQDPDEALYEGMPRSALRHVAVDAVLPLDRMVPWILEHAVGTRVQERDGATDPAEPVDPDPSTHASVSKPPGTGTRFTCPDCGGVLFEHHEGPLTRFACSVGHAYSIESLSTAQGEALENALWAAVRALEDRAALLRRMSDLARRDEHARSADLFREQAEEALARAGAIREAAERTFAAGVAVAN